MAEEKLLTVRDVSLILGISEKEVVDLAQSGKLPAYNVGGIFLRFKRQQVLNFKSTHKEFAQRANPLRQQDASKAPEVKVTLDDKISDFFYFNDFYILSALIIALILVIIFQRY